MNYFRATEALYHTHPLKHGEQHSNHKFREHHHRAELMMNKYKYLLQMFDMVKVSRQAL